MAHALPGARSIVCLRATRTRDGRTRSNLVWSHGNATIPRHLRGVVVTEYGIADLRGRADGECGAALLNVADSRFQDALLAAAKAARMPPESYAIPGPFRQNLPQRLERALGSHRRAGLFTDCPFGTDLTAEEIPLGRAPRSPAGRRRRGAAPHGARSAGELTRAARRRRGARHWCSGSALR